MSRFRCTPLCLLLLLTAFASVCQCLPTQDVTATAEEPVAAAVAAEEPVAATVAAEEPVAAAVAAEEPKKEKEDTESASSAPKITYSKETIVDTGETVTLDCDVKNLNLEGLAEFKIKWGKVETMKGEEEKEKEEGATESVLKISSNEQLLLFSDKYEVIHPEDTYRYSLQIASATEKDSGVYRCTVFFGEDQQIDADVPVTVQRAAYFSDTSSKTMTVSEGDSISIDCQPGGSPAPEVYWERVGEDLPYYGGQFFKANNFELPHIERSHKGRYRCYADNGLGAPATSEVVIEVEYKPVVEVSEKAIAAFVYDPVQMDCTAVSSPEPQVVWMRDGLRVIASANIVIDTTTKSTDKGATTVSSKLSIHEVQIDDFLEYTCVAENELGASIEHVKLQMKTPPNIEKQTTGEKIYELAENQRARNELPIALECESSGVPAPTYRWTKDQKILLWQTDPRMSLEMGTGTLLIREPNIKDNGIYQCFAYNELGMAASDFITLRNNTMIDFIREEPENVEYEAELGRPYRFACPKATGHPKPELTWMKSREREEGIEMEFLDTERLVVDENGVLWISHVLEEDDTAKNDFKFTCLATSELHPQDISLAKTISLKVVPPSDGKYNLEDELMNIESFLMHSSSKDKKFQSNEVNKLWCIFAGEPLPQVIWQRTNEKAITEDRFYVQNNGQTLVFKDTQLEDAGDYECLASNGIGNTKKLTIHVDVEVKPKFRSDFKAQAQVVNEGTTVTFACDIFSEAEASPMYQWFFNSQPIEGVEGSRRKMEGSNLIIKSTKVADIGNYACKASNDVGYTYGQTTLSVIPRGPSVLQSASHYQADSKVLEEIQSQIETLSSDVMTLRDIVMEQVEGNKVRQDMAALLTKIATKVLNEPESPMEKSPVTKEKV